MIRIDDKSKCSGCHACFSVCPQNCIYLEEDEEGFLYPKADGKKCTDCGLCERVCPVFRLVEDENSKVPTAYAAVNNREDIRLQSSSGGIFTVLAEYVVEQGGVVFGAAFSEDYKSVHHIAVENMDALEKLRGSKYVQSSVGNCYKQAKEFLERGRLVLFTGTPCQIDGLRVYLHKNYANLYTQDLICHGVPSSLVWKKYIELREKKAASSVQSVFFRDKKYGWKIYSLAVSFENGRVHRKKYFEDLFVKGFFSHLYLRPSCYNCASKQLSRQSDITLADFWKIEDILPELDDDKGTSLVLVHSKKGQQLWKAVCNQVQYIQVDTKRAIEYNPSMLQSAKLPEKRNEFMKDMQKYPIEYVLKGISGFHLANVLKKDKTFVIKDKMIIEGGRR